jgi:hypothetical protein
MLVGHFTICQIIKWLLFNNIQAIWPPEACILPDTLKVGCYTAFDLRSAGFAATRN